MLLTLGKQPGGGGPPKSKAQKWFDGFRSSASGAFDPTYVQRLGLFPGKPARVAAASGLAWTYIGPRNLIHENIYGSPVSAGRVNAVLPVDDNLMFAGADRGGVWRSLDGGITWRALTDHLPFPAITSLAGDGTYIYAGTGHGVVLYSSDGGDSWNWSAIPGAVRVSSVVMSYDGSIVAGVESEGVYVSRDRGRTWTRRLALPRTIPVLVRNGERLWVEASQWDTPVSKQGLYRSDDGGATWSEQALPFVTGSPRTLRLAAAGTTLYLAASSSTRLEGFYRSTDGGGSWVTVKPRFPEFVCAVGNGHCPPVEVVATHPNKPNTVLLGRVWLYRSTDGGDNFSDINKSASGVVPHVDHRAVAFSADGSRIYDGNDGGIWTAGDGEVPDWKSLSADLGITQFYPGLSLHPTDPDQLLAGTQDNSFVLWRDGVWRCGFTGDFMWTQIDPRNPRTAFAVLYPGREMVVRTKNDWADFSFVSNGMDTENAPWISPLEMDPANPNRLYFGTVRVFRTDNQGDRWQTISPELGTVSALAADRDDVYAAVSGKILAYRGGTTWDTISTAAMPGRNVSRLLTVNGTVWAAYSGLRASDGKGHLYFSPDHGATWVDRTSNLPDSPVNDLIADPDAPGTYYIGSDIGVYRTIDEGFTWEQLGSGLPLTTVSSIRLHRPTRILRAATYGRGIWDLRLEASR